MRLNLLIACASTLVMSGCAENLEPPAAKVSPTKMVPTKKRVPLYQVKFGDGGIEEVRTHDGKLVMINDQFCPELPPNHYEVQARPTPGPPAKAALSEADWKMWVDALEASDQERQAALYQAAMLHEICVAVKK